MIRLLLLTENISLYNRKLFMDLAKFYDLTIGFTRKDEVGEVPFRKLLMPVLNLGPFIVVRRGLLRLCKNSDLVIIMPDLHYLSFVMLPFIPFRQFRVISWGIGMRASYSLAFDVDRRHTALDYIYRVLLYRCDRNLFYSKKPFDFWKDSIIERKSRVAVNTIFVDRSLRSTSSERSIFLFVGSLYKEKGVDILLKNYLKLYNEYNSKAPELVIIGDGEELRNLVVYCEMNGLEDKVRFLGRVTNEEQLAKYFNKSLCLITPNQAGLTVLKALFYGVPVLTSKHAITGGELYNIIDDYNGQLFTSEEEIYPYLKKYMNNPKYVSHLSSNALLSYESSASYDMQLTSFKTVLNELV